LAYGLLDSPVAWGVLRLINGFRIACMTSATEIWLNDLSGDATRGRVSGGYMLILYLVIAAGQTLVKLGTVGGSDHLMMASALISLCPIATTRLSEPDLMVSKVLDIIGLVEASRVGVLGAGDAGMLVGSFYALGMVFDL
tara:strand:- start:767 stop:1186 length:420 start_codon:yes stop_codon:yes gene_type:complete